MRRSPLADVPGLGDLDPTVRRVLALVLGGLVARLIALGDRVAHFDEGRVAWWTGHFVETGSFEYRFIIHGPFVQHVNAHLFPILGYSDFAMRLLVALVGAALPLAALLFREHLDAEETVGVAFFLALNPLLLYYSRFFRSTLLVAAFAFVAFGLLVRAYDERAARYVHGAAAFVALAFAAKENAAVYLIVWVGATALLVDHALFRTGDDRSGLDWLTTRLNDHRGRLDQARAAHYLGHAVLAVVVFCAVSLYFYAPRTPATDAPGFWSALANPTQFPSMVSATLDDVIQGYGYWFGGSTDPGCHKDNVIDGYLCYLGRSLRVLGEYALPLSLFSLFGFAAERWGRARSRALVLFAGYWGFVSVFGYPLGTDIFGAWIMVNALVPLAIPAGVGLALVVGWTRDAVGRDSVRVGVGAFVLLLVLGQIGVAAATGVYANDTADENTLVQYAQPADDFRPATSVLEGRAADHEDPDVLFVGSEYVREEPRGEGIRPRCTGISRTLPVQWYLFKHDATGECAQTTADAASTLEETDPILVVAPADLRSELESELEGYEAATYRLRTRGSEAVFFYRPAE